ncbi:MAG: hypothetical protein JW713_06440 [Pontiellaceae bacterium]|nr:hypothetical protein [Pontiellaceae bacterium]
MSLVFEDAKILSSYRFTLQDDARIRLYKPLAEELQDERLNVQVDITHRVVRIIPDPLGRYGVGQGNTICGLAVLRDIVPEGSRFVLRRRIADGAMDFVPEQDLMDGRDYYAHK